MESYVNMKARHEKEINEFPFGFAFSKEQFKDMMSNWGLNEENTDKIISIGMGGYIRKSDKEAMHDLFKRHKEEKEKGYKNNDFLQGAIEYELANYEYIITYDLEPTLNALGFSLDILQDKRFKTILEKAKKNYLKNMEKLGW